GRTIDTRPLSGVSRGELIQLMVGRELSAVFPKKDVEKGEVALELRGLSSTAAGGHDVDLEGRAGGVVGLAGLVGSGRTELAEVIFGLVRRDAGEILVKSQPVTFASAAQAIAAGVAYLPEDRRHHGVILDMPVAANVSLASLD